MKYEIILLVVTFASIALAAPQKSDKDAQIVSQDSNIEPDGAYQWSFETDNGIKADETGTLKKATGPDASDVITSAGSFRYTAPDGTPIEITYIADDVGGFQPSGAHLPTPPPIPPAIQKAVDLLLSLQRKR